LGWEWIIILVLAAFLAEYIDSSLGMGYGTTLTPVLLLFGIAPAVVVPAVLFSEFCTGIMAGMTHHVIGNVDFETDRRAISVVKTLVLCSVIGTVAAVLVAISISPVLVKLYIGGMVLSIGIFMAVTRRMKSSFSWSKIRIIGTVAAFNKGISGGGYGPLITGGQVLSGVPIKNAIGITSLSEGLVCFIALVMYLVLGGGIAWGYAIPMTIGALLSVPIAAWTVKKIPTRILRDGVMYLTILLGVLTLAKALL